jgi:hypothetical protein
VGDGMTSKLHKAITNAEKAIEDVTGAFEKQVDEIASQDNKADLEKWVNAYRAMQDSGHIYVTWAKHYAGMDEEGESFLDEGSM